MNTKEIIRSILLGLQKLQQAAYDKGLNMEITTRSTNKVSPWIVGLVNIEGADFVNDAKGTTHIFFTFHPYYEFYTEEENLKDYNSEIEKIKKFIEDHEN